MSAPILRILAPNNICLCLVSSWAKTYSRPIIDLKILYLQPDLSYYHENMRCMIVLQRSDFHLKSIFLSVQNGLLMVLLLTSDINLWIMWIGKFKSLTPKPRRRCANVYVILLAIIKLHHILNDISVPYLAYNLINNR